jgi:hypothetical protein
MGAAVGRRVAVAVGVGSGVLDGTGVSVAVRVKAKTAVAIRVGVRVEPGDAVTSASGRCVGWEVKWQADTSTSTMTNTTPIKHHLLISLLEVYGICIHYLLTRLGDDHGIPVKERPRFLVIG